MTPSKQCQALLHISKRVTFEVTDPSFPFLPTGIPPTSTTPSTCRFACKRIMKDVIHIIPTNWHTINQNQVSADYVCKRIVRDVTFVIANKRNMRAAILIFANEWDPNTSSDQTVTHSIPESPAVLWLQSPPNKDAQQDSLGL